MFLRSTFEVELVAMRLKIILPAVLAVVALAVPSANAGLLDPLAPIVQLVLPTCGAQSYPFAQWGDTNAYYPVPNAGFESGTTGWSVSGGSLVYGNEPWYVNGNGSRSLSLRPGGSVRSPLTCINLLDPFFRMFAKSNGANGPLKVQVYFYGLTGNLTGILNVESFDPSGYDDWAPTGTIPSVLALPLLTRYAQLRVTSGATSGTWQIDDVFVDPWVSGV
jgi:hypothetical protein